MKKIILTLATVAFIGIGGSAVSAQVPPTVPGAPNPLPTECSENDQKVPPINDDGVPANCVKFYVEESVGVLPPAGVQPPAAATPIVPESAGSLPQTGSGISPILGIGALLLVGGGIVMVAGRRRSTATPAT